MQCVRLRDACVQLRDACAARVCIDGEDAVNVALKDMLANERFRMRMLYIVRSVDAALEYILVNDRIHRLLIQRTKKALGKTRLYLIYAAGIRVPPQRLLVSDDLRKRRYDLFHS